MLKPALVDVKSRAEAALGESPIHTLRGVIVEQSGETLTLSGRVDTFYHKQLAQELIRAIADDCECAVINCVDVEYTSELRTSYAR